MDISTQEDFAARAILYVAKGVCTVDFPNTYTASYSEKVIVVQNANKVFWDGMEVVWIPMRFDGLLWNIISKRIPELSKSPFESERDLLPLAKDILRTSLKEWGTPVLEDSPDNPAGRRTPGWEAKYDPFDPK